MHLNVDSDINFRETASYKAAISEPHNISADKTLKEQLQYSDETFPLGVRTVIYKYLIDNTLNCHWHNDFEYGVLLDGNVDFYINDTPIRLEKGDAFFVNSNILHMGRQAENSKDAVMYTLTFPTSLLSANINSSIYTKYLQPLLSTRVEGFKITCENPVGRYIKALLLEIYKLEPSAFGYELECLMYFNRLWLTTLRYMEDNKDSLHYHTGNMRHSDRMKEILSYIHSHVNQKITVDGIANHVNISRGECFRCFKHYLNKTIIEYTNKYRLQRAAKLLRETEKSLSDISADCGFESASYFSKIFKIGYSMTPLQYRKAQIWTDNAILNINAYDYEYWKDSGNGTMMITANADNGSFSCEWHNTGNILFRSGKKLSGFKKTHKQLGNISLQFDASYHSAGCSYLCVYGWTVDPLIEWYIVECCTAFHPSNYFTLLGTFDIDGGTYEIYQNIRVNKPSIHGVGTFGQYWSVRKSARFSGIVDVSAHLYAWESIGLAMGGITEVALLIEGWQSSGNATINTNILTFTLPSKIYGNT